jgi:hypothetical protein
VTIKPRIYNFAIATINKTVANMLKKSIKKDMPLFKKKQMEIFRLEETIKKIKYDIQNTFSYDLAFLSKIWESRLKTVCRQ